jgi:hypothetical protein
MRRVVKILTQVHKQSHDDRLTRQHQTPAARDQRRRDPNLLVLVIVVVVAVMEH